MDSNMLDYDLAKSVGSFFHLGKKEMDKIIEEVRIAVGKWRQVAAEIGISRAEQELMAPAFALSIR
jgi:serine/threonine-protein kinase HipA